MATSKRQRKQLMKAYNTVVNDSGNNQETGVQWKKRTQMQLQSLDKIHLEQDEFTEYQSLKKTLQDFVVNAQNLETSYQAHRKNVIQTVALELEDELKRIGKTELICRISEELINILRQAGVKWNPIYLRRCLDERYKDPTNRANALARKAHPVVPQDTDRTAEELEASLNRPSLLKGEYMVVTNAKFSMNFKTKSDAWQWLSVLYNIEKKGRANAELMLGISLIITARHSDQSVTVKLDMEELKKKISSEYLDHWAEPEGEVRQQQS